jgi:hypothetical protein
MLIQVLKHYWSNAFFHSFHFTLLYTEFGTVQLFYVVLMSNYVQIIVYIQLL